MITSIEQCKEIQQRRVAAKKRGYAKAVRNFVAKLSQTHNKDLPENEQDKLFYRTTMNTLPVSWKKKKEEKSI